MFDVINSIDFVSLFIGFISCMFFDILFSIANYYLTKAFMIKKCKKCKYNKNCQTT